MTTTLGKTESILIALFVSIAFPYSTFILAWWGSVLLHAPEKVVVCSALAGYGFGWILVVARWKRWRDRFYCVSNSVGVLVYLFWSLVALASLMGLPLGNLALGALAGLYVGRQAHHWGLSTPVFRRQARRVGLFTAAIFGLIAVTMGLLAIQERETMQVILGLVGLSSLAATDAGRVGLVVIAVPLSIGIQYRLARATASWGFRIGCNNAGISSPA